jgi:uncharacterized OB-fold protein
VSAGSVAGMHCGACGAQTAPPQPVCPKCGDDHRLEARAIPGEGRLYSFTIVRVPPEGLEGDAPYALGIIELPGGARITARIDTKDFDALVVDGPVRLAREQKGVYFFAPPD